MAAIRSRGRGQAFSLSVAPQPPGWPSKGGPHWYADPCIHLAGVCVVLGQMYFTLLKQLMSARECCSSFSISFCFPPSSILLEWLRIFILETLVTEKAAAA